MIEDEYKIPEIRARWHVVVIRNLFWIICAAAALIILFYARTFFLTIMGIADTDFFTVRAIDKAIFLIAGMMLLILTIFLHFVFEDAKTQGKAVQNLGRVLGIEALVLLAMHLTTEAMMGFKTTDPVTYAVMVIELVVGVGFLVFSILIKPTNVPADAGKSEFDK